MSWMGGWGFWSYGWGITKRRVGKELSPWDYEHCKTRISLQSR